MKHDGGVPQPKTIPTGRRVGTRIVKARAIRPLELIGRRTIWISHRGGWIIYWRHMAVETTTGTKDSVCAVMGSLASERETEGQRGSREAAESPLLLL